jgi:serine protease Do
MISYSGGSTKISRKTCAGLVLDKAGHVLIPWVVKPDDAERVEVWVGDVEHRARVLKSNKQASMTILLMDKPDEQAQPLPLKSATLKTGEWGIIVEPSDEHSDYAKFTHVRMNQGIMDGYYRMYKMDSISSRCDGAPIFSVDGRIAGVIHRYSFFVWDDYVDDIKELLQQIENDKSSEDDDSKNKDGWLGVTLSPINKEYARLKKLSKSALWVIHVYADSPAAAAGVKDGDLIVAANGEPLRLSGGRAHKYFVQKLHPTIGKPFELTVIRDGKLLALNGVFTEKDEPKIMKADDLGITIQSISDVDYTEKSLFTHKGVLVQDIRRGGAAATSTSFGRTLIGKNDVIVELDGNPTPDIDAFASVLEKIRREKKETVLVRYYRGRTAGFAGLNLKIGKNDNKEGDE